MVGQRGIGDPKGSGSGRYGRSSRWIVVMCCIALVGAGCGTRLSRTQIQAENALIASSPSGSSSPGTQPETSGEGTGGLGASTGGSSGPASVDSGANATVGPPIGRGSTGSPGTSGAQTVQTTSGPTNGGLGSGPSGGGTACAGSPTGTPIVVGFIGDMSGFGASTSVPAQEMWSAWAKLVNASGGIHCHPVQVLVGDDGGSTSADVSIAQQFVQNDGAIALTVATTDPGPIASFAQSHSVPVVGSELGGDPWHQDPFMFPTFADAIAGVWGAARIAKGAGVTKVGTLYCVESPALCKSSNDQFVADAQADGLQVVYQGAVSLTQPDYTASCLQARSAGAQLIFLAADSNTVVRVAQSCTRQSYTPIYDVPTGEDSMASIPQLNGAISAEQTFPWFVRSGGPGIDEYVRALKQYAPSLFASGYVSQSWGWVSAKVFQDAATIGTAGLLASARATSQNILNGLWSMRGDTEQGLDPGSMGRYFARGRPTSTTYCVIEAKVENGKWVAPQGLTPICR